MRSDDVSLKRLSVRTLKQAKTGLFNASTLHRSNAFALYEVLLGITIFALGVIALGHAVENCLNASTINAEEGVIRQILSNHMAEIQAARGVPDDSKEFKIASNYGAIKVVQKTAAAGLTEPDNTLLDGLYLVTLTAHWQRGGVPQSKQVKFYVYRPG
jgi:hypothetical protein